MSKKISLIIPIFNSEKYLNETIESVRNQSYKNLEIILVDDGSTDGSKKICDLNSKRDSRIKVVHQENKTTSGARNAGLSISTGDYIMFSDSDDVLDKFACEKMYKAIEEKNADFIIGNYDNMDESGKIWEQPVFDINKYKDFKLSIKDYDKSFYIMNSSVCNKIFRKTFLEKNNIKFENSLPAEDAVFTTYCFIKSKNVYYIPEIIFHYRQRYDGSRSNRCSKEFFFGISKAYKIIYENFKNSNELEYYRYFYAKSMNYILYKFIDTDKLSYQDRIDILDKMKWFYNLSIILKIPSILKPVQYILDSINNEDYEQALKYCELLAEVRKMMPNDMKEKMSKPDAETYKVIASKK